MELCHIELRHFQKDVDKQIRNTLQEHLEVCQGQNRGGRPQVNLLHSFIWLLIYSQSPSSSLSASGFW